MNMVNNTGKVGAVGVIPWFAATAYPILLLKVDAGEVKCTCGSCRSHIAFLGFEVSYCYILRSRLPGPVDSLLSMFGVPLLRW